MALIEMSTPQSVVELTKYGTCTQVLYFSTNLRYFNLLVSCHLLFLLHCTF